MELTDREKQLLILYKAFFAKDFDVLDLDSIQDFQNVYCILQTLPSSVGTRVSKITDFKLSVDGVFSNTLDTELTKLSQACDEVKEFNKNISNAYFMPITVACTNPDIDLSSDQGILTSKDYALFAKACLFSQGTRKTKKELEDFLEEEMKPKTEEEELIDTIKGKRNIHLAHYIVQLLRGYGVIDDYPYIEEEQGKFREDLPTLNSKEKELLRNYYLFYGKYFDTDLMYNWDNAVNASCILQSFPKEVGVESENNYEFLKSRIIDRIESPKLKEVMDGLKLKKEDIVAYYNGASVNQVPISKILLESGFTTVDSLGRVANACLFVNAHADISGKEVLDYLNKLDHDDGFLNNSDDNLNKKIVNILERYGLIKRHMGKKSKCETCPYHEEVKKEQVGVVKKLARILGGQK